MHRDGRDGLAYGDEGGPLKLTGIAAPSPAGAAILTGSPIGDRVTAVAAFSLNSDGGGTNVFSVSGPAAVPVPIGIVPDLSNPSQFAAELSIREVKLGTDFERDFWETRLPTNMTANPGVSFTPKTAGSGLAVKVTVYRNNGGTLTQLGSFQTTPGGTGTFTLSPFSSLQNAKVAFLVEPLAGNVGDGIYTLEMSVATGDPHPFEVTETAWKTYGSNPANPPAGIATLPQHRYRRARDCLGGGVRRRCGWPLPAVVPRHVRIRPGNLRRGNVHTQLMQRLTHARPNEHGGRSVEPSSTAGGNTETPVS